MRIPAPPIPVETGLPGPANSVTFDILDGWLVHAAVLSTGAAATLLSGQVLMVREMGASESQAAFAHGVPNSAGVSTVTALEDRRIRRELLKSYQIPAPDSAVFSVRRGYQAAVDYAEGVGWPVRLKPVVGEAGVEVISDIEGPDDLARAFEYLGIAPTRRPSFTSSSYSFTQIFMPQGGSGLAKPGYEVMVEAQMRGSQLRLVMVEDELVSAIQGSPGEGLLQDVRETIHDSVIALAERISSLFPDLRCISVELVLEDPEQTLEGQTHQVLDVSERPWLYVQYHMAADEAERIAHRILHSAGFEGQGVKKSVSLNFRWEGLAAAEQELTFLARAAASTGVEAHVEVGDELGGSLVGSFTGSPGTIALLTELAVAGHLLNDPVMCAESDPR